MSYVNYAATNQIPLSLCVFTDVIIITVNSSVTFLLFYSVYILILAIIRPWDPFKKIVFDEKVSGIHVVIFFSKHSTTGVLKFFTRHIFFLFDLKPRRSETRTCLILVYKTFLIMFCRRKQGKQTNRGN